MNSQPQIHPLPTALSLTTTSTFTRTFARILILAFFLFLLAILFLPWRQFVTGTGRVIAFNPLERRIQIESQLSGRVKKLFVSEGQFVKSGEILVEIQDNDPDLLANLAKQREAIENRKSFASDRVQSLNHQIQQQQLAKSEAVASAEQRVNAAQVAANTAQLHHSRTLTLHSKHLESQRNLELATLARDAANAELISSQAALKRTSIDIDAAIASTTAAKNSALSDVANADRDLANLSVQINQNQRQSITAPRDGYILQIEANEGNYLKPGSPICVIIPETTSRFVEITIDGNDLPLLHAKTHSSPGSPVRLAFEGWPAIQAVGWPQLAIGTFAGEVIVIDASDNGSGKFRVVVAPATDTVNRWDGKGPVSVNWPDPNQWLRQGVRTNAWIMLDEVPLWYEIWRKINGFPPVPQSLNGKLDPTKK